jgi:hypothetical protein
MRRRRGDVVVVVVHLRVNKARLTPDGTGVVLGSGSFKGPREDARVTEDA